MKSRSLRAFMLSWMLMAGGVPLRAQALREQAWGILRTGVNEKTSEKRTPAIRVLGLLRGDSEGQEIAGKALEDEKPEVRAAAATALGQMRCIGCIPNLRKALADKEASVVLAAAQALQSLGDKTAYEVYYAVLTGRRKTGGGLLAEQEKMLKDPKKMAQFGFEQGIGFIPFASLGWGVAKALRKDDVSPVRAAAAAVLAKDPDPRSGKALVKAAFGKSWIVRAAALDAIAKRGDPRLLNDIAPAMSDEKELVRYAAAAAVIRLSTIAESAKDKKK